MTLETEGVVLRIERSSIHDGPGLRTVLFLKGCPLSCSWCSTPESQNKLPEKGYDGSRCAGCSTCVLNCPEGAITMVNGSIVTDAARCSSCFRCVDICPHNAQKGYGRVMTVKQAVEEISKDEIFFFHSNGGVTISGGECFLQPDFTASVLEHCHLRNIDTAVETSLLAPWKSIALSLPFVNSLYADIKHYSSERHKKLTGVGNQLIMANLNKLDQSQLSFRLHLRVPLIPGINDDDDNLAAIVSCAESLERVKDIEILPYHRLGTATYMFLARKYHLEDLDTPTVEYLDERLTFMSKQSRSLEVKFGSGYL